MEVHVAASRAHAHTCARVRARPEREGTDKGESPTSTLLLALTGSGDAAARAVGMNQLRLGTRPKSARGSWEQVRVHTRRFTKAPACVSACCPRAVVPESWVDSPARDKMLQDSDSRLFGDQAGTHRGGSGCQARACDVLSVSRMITPRLGLAPAVPLDDFPFSRSDARRNEGMFGHVGSFMSDYR